MTIAGSGEAIIGSTVTQNIYHATLPPAFPNAPFAVPYRRNPALVGREADLKRLVTQLGPDTPVAICGLGGVGKTQLVVEYAYRYKAKYPGGVFWLAMEQPASVGDQVASYAGAMGVHLQHAENMLFVERREAVYAAWQADTPRLLIFDNCEDAALVNDWCPRTGGCHVLITSRRQNWPEYTGVIVLPLNRLDRSASLTVLLRHRANALGTTVAALTTAVADTICDILGDLPLALAVAGAYLGDLPTTRMDRFMNRLQKAVMPDPALLAALDAPLPTGHVPSIVATFATSYNRLQPADPNHAVALRLLHRAAWAASEPLPSRLVQRLAALDPTSDPTDDTVEEAAMAVRRLTSVGVAESLPEGAVRLHSLLAAYARWRSRDTAFDDQKAMENALVWELYILYEEGSPPLGTQYIPHTRQAIVCADNRADAAASQLLNNLSKLLFDNEDSPVPEHEDATDARTRYENALSFAEQTLDPSDPEITTYLNQLALLLQRQGDFVQACSLLERALLIAEQANSPSHITQSLDNLAAIFQAQGNISEARALYERALTIREECLGPKHPDTATSLWWLAIIAEQNGNMAAARPLLERALAIFEATLGQDHPSTHFVHAKLAEIVSALTGPQNL